MMILEELGWKGERYMSRGGEGMCPVEGGIFVPLYACCSIWSLRGLKLAEIQQIVLPVLGGTGEAILSKNA